MMFSCLCYWSLTFNNQNHAYRLSTDLKTYIIYPRKNRPTQVGKVQTLSNDISKSLFKSGQYSIVFAKRNLKANCQPEQRVPSSRGADTAGTLRGKVALHEVPVLYQPQAWPMLYKSWSLSQPLTDLAPTRA